MRGLQALYKKLNQELFDNRLPHYQVRLSSGGLPGAVGGLCRRWPRVILLRRELRGDRLREVLLHEMCHAATEGEFEESGLMHGPRFQRDLSRLAALGETWAETTLTDCRNDNQPLDTLRQEIEATPASPAMQRRLRMLARVLCEPPRGTRKKK